MEISILNLMTKINESIRTQFYWLFIFLISVALMGIVSKKFPIIFDDGKWWVKSRKSLFFVWISGLPLGFFIGILFVNFSDSFIFQILTIITIMAINSTFAVGSHIHSYWEIKTYPERYKKKD